MDEKEKAKLLEKMHEIAERILAKDIDDMDINTEVNDLVDIDKRIYEIFEEEENNG